MIKEPTYDENGWAWFEKDPDDQFWYGANVAADLEVGSTSIASVTALLGAGMEKLAEPEYTGAVVRIKLGGVGTTDADSFCTFRISCANGERFDRTIAFKKVNR